MQSYRVEIKVEQNGTLTVQNLSLRVGDTVEVVILVQPPIQQATRYPLRGLSVRYDNPTASIAQHDWDAA